jgi:trigger factor
VDTVVDIILPSYASISVRKSDLRIEEMAAHERPAALREVVIRAALDGCEVPVPETDVSRRVDMMIENFKRQLAVARMDFAEYLNQAGKSEELMRDQLREMARATIQKEAVLWRIAQAEGIAVEPQEVEARVAEIAALSGAAPAEMRDTLESAGRLPIILQEILFDKVGDFLVERCLLE